MIKLIRHLKTLYNNPFIFGQLLHAFYNVRQNCCDKDFLLSYLILPMTLYPASQQYLTQRKHPESSLRILSKQSERLYGLKKRIEEYRELTNLTMQYAIDIGVLKINENLSVDVLSEWPAESIFLCNAVKAAIRLGEFTGKFDIPTTYRILGVKKL